MREIRTNFLFYLDYLKEIKKNEKEFLQQNDKKTMEEDEEPDKISNKKQNEDKENVLIPRTTLPLTLKNNLNKT